MALPLRLAGKRALVTGSSRGIGAEVARVFAREGAQVVVNYRTSREDAGKAVKAIRRAGGDAFAVGGDVSDPKSVSRMFAEIKRRLGGLDALVNNAGLSDPSLWNPKLQDTTLEMWQKVFAVDAFGTFLCSQAAVPLMKGGGSIVNIASTPALSGDVEGLVYASAKGAVVSMTRMLAKMLAPRVRVNCMVFGSFETTWVDWLDRKQLQYYRSSIPLKRFGKPRDAANLALYLASDESSYVTGQSLVIDGGEILH
ncbi:MAG: 3-oxoacyl-ACP reductase FabG [Nitrososphaerales archaeon]|nr:3-oxoacyl-ACP reductase FabG [Nitrososphaerales archaeon]